LFCYRQNVIHFNAEVPDGAFDLAVAEEKLHRSQISGSAIDQSSLGSPKRMGAKSFESNPTLAIRSDTSRAYCRVVMHCPSPRLPVNRKSPDFLPAIESELTKRA
jgi:hypothetical protein